MTPLKHISANQLMRSRSRRSSFTVEHISEITGSTWEVVFDSEFNIVKVFLNDKRIKVKGEREEILWRYFNNRYELGRIERESRYED